MDPDTDQTPPPQVPRLAICFEKSRCVRFGRFELMPETGQPTYDRRLYDPTDPQDLADFYRDQDLVAIKSTVSGTGRGNRLRIRVVMVDPAPATAEKAAPSEEITQPAETPAAQTEASAEPEETPAPSTVPPSLEASTDPFAQPGSVTLPTPPAPEEEEPQEEEPAPDPEPDPDPPKPKGKRTAKKKRASGDGQK